MSEEELFNKEKEIRMKYATLLLAELLNVNYEYNKNTVALHSYNSLQDNINYTEEEKEKIISDAIKLVKEKYDITINN